MVELGLLAIKPQTELRIDDFIYDWLKAGIGKLLSELGKGFINHKLGMLKSRRINHSIFGAGNSSNGTVLSSN